MPQIQILLNFDEIKIADKQIFPVNLDFSKPLNLEKSEIFELQKFAEYFKIPESEVEYYLNCRLLQKQPKYRNFYLEIFRFAQNLGTVINNANIDIKGEFVDYFGKLASVVFLRILIYFQGHLKFGNFCNYVSTISNGNKIETITGVGKITMKNEKLEIFGIAGETLIKTLPEKYIFEYNLNTKTVKSVQNIKFSSTKGTLIVEDKVENINKKDGNLFERISKFIKLFDLKFKGEFSNLLSSKYFRTQSRGKIEININKKFDMIANINDTLNFDDPIAEIENKIILEKIDLVERLNLKKNDNFLSYLQVLSGEFIKPESIIAQKKSFVGVKYLQVRNLNAGIVELTNINSGIVNIIDKSKIALKAKFNGKIDSVVTNQQIIVGGICKVIDLDFTNFESMEGELKVIDNFEEIDVTKNYTNCIAFVVENIGFKELFNLARLSFSKFILPSISFQGIIEFYKSNLDFQIAAIYGFGDRELSNGIVGTIKELDNHYINISNKKLKIIL